jgi:hypothetical protein
MLPDRLLSRGMSNGDVEGLLRHLWLHAAELVQQGSASHARPEC